MVARVGFEPAKFRMQGTEFTTTEPAHPTIEQKWCSAANAELFIADKSSDSQSIVYMTPQNKHNTTFPIQT